MWAALLAILVGALAVIAVHTFSSVAKPLAVVEGKSRAQKKRGKWKGKKGKGKDISETDLGCPLTWEQCCLPVEEALAKSAIRRDDMQAAAVMYQTALVEYKDHKHRRETMARVYGSIPDLCCSAERRLNRLKPHAAEASSHGDHVLYIATTICTLVYAIEVRSEGLNPGLRICLLMARFASRFDEVLLQETNKEIILRDVPSANLVDIRASIHRWGRMAPKRPNAYRR
jgi:hypothetical protein